MPTALENVFYEQNTVRSDVACLFEYNMNALIDGVSVSNVTVDNTYTSDAAYRAQISHTNFQTDPHGSTIAYPADGPIPFKKLFPLDSVVEPYRPSSCGIKYSIPGIGDNMSVGTGGDKLVKFNSILYPSTSPRLYYPGISTTYKYWVGAKNKNIALKVTYKHDLASWAASGKKGSIPTGNKNAIANKIVVKFEKYHSKPITGWAIITKSDGTVLPNVALPFGDYGSGWNGEIILYYNGTTWSKTEPSSYTNTQEIKSIQINAWVPQGITPSADIGVIEISARWVKDLSSDIESISLSQNSSDQSSVLPVGNAMANSIQLSMANRTQVISEFRTKVYDRNITSFNPSLTYLAKGVKVTPYFKIYHSNAVDVAGVYDKVKQGTYYMDTYNVSEYGEYSVGALDGSKILSEIFCPDILCENYPATAILRRLLDSVGFTNYNFNVVMSGDEVSDNSIPQINYWWTEDTSSVWEAIQELCKDIQFNAFFDENGILQFYTRNYIYNTSREVNWSFFYSSYGGSLPNIISFAKQEIPSANSVRVLWTTPITSNYIGQSSDLWKSPPSYLSAGNLETDMTAESDEFTISTKSIDPYSKQQSFYNFSGFVLIDSEVVEYDAIGYQYVALDGTLIPHVWVTSNADISKYRYLAKPGAEDINNYQETSNFRPNGRYRVKKDQYDNLVGRGALGTEASAHLTANDSMLNWTVREVQF